MKFDNIPVLNHVQVAQLIAAVGHKRTVLVQGENGIGKTALVNTAKAMPKFANHLFPKPVDCAQLDVGDHIVPVPDMELGVTRGLPNERYGINIRNQLGINGSRPVFSALDEMAKCPKHIQASLAPWFYDRRIGSYEAPEGSVVCGFTNLSVEGLGDFMPAHTRNRIIVVTMRKPTMEEWMMDFADPHNLSAEVRAFAKQHSYIFDSFLDYEPGGKHSGKSLEKENPYIFNPRAQQAGYITPRSLHAASDIIIEGKHLAPEVVLSALGGTLGAEGANQLSTYVRFGRDLPDTDRIKQEPEDCPLPSSSVAQIVLVYKLVGAANDRKDAEAISIYVKRMKEEMQSLFCHTVATNPLKVSKFASVDVFSDMLKAHNIYFQQ